MRILPTALAISAVLHGSAIAYVVARKPVLVVAVPDTRTTTVTIEEPMAVALLDDHTPVPERATPSSPSNTPTPTHRAEPARSAHVSTTTSHGGTETRPAATTGSTDGTTTHEGPKSSLMTMRHPEVSNGMSNDFMQHFLDSSKPLDPETIALRADESAIDRGKDAHNIRHDGAGYKSEDTPYDAKIEPDGTTHLKDKPTFDATDALMRKEGIDPYAAKKLKWLDETREERYRLGKQYKEQLLGRSGELARKNLQYLWAKLASTADRKQALFDLWDEVAETGSEELVSAGLNARGQIIGFIRVHLTGADAYTATELAKLNASKKSTATFDPYAN